MAGSTFQPPIHLDPTQDASQQTAFINNNFQQIASTLESNSFRIVSKGTTTISSDGSPTSYTTIGHNLGFVPIPFAFLNNLTFGSISNNATLPFPTWTSETTDTVGHQIVFKTWLQIIADTTNVYIVLFNSTGSAISALPVSYYLCQQPASN